MNYLAHDIVLPEGADPLTRVATAVPDLWPLLPTRQLALVIMGALRTSSVPHARAVAVGIHAHLRADAIFHRHPEFVRRIELLTPELHELWPGLRHAEFAAHVLVEMLLDRWLLQSNARLVDGYFDCFSTRNIEVVSRLGTTNEVAREGLGRILESFPASAFLADYRTAEGLVFRFARVLSRSSLVTREDVPTVRIATRVEAWSRQLEQGSAELLADVRAGIGPWDGAKG